MFRGVTNLNIDSKGRVAMPARYRDRLRESCEGQLVVTVDRDGCLLVYPLPEWERIEAAVMARPNIDPQVRQLQRVFVGYATDVEMDGQARILIAPTLREQAKLDKHVVLVGQGNKFELWDEAVWAAQRDEWLQSDAFTSGLSEALSSLSI
ncbi:division/cell wall cluster transcriptional repressor MraZ [Acidihalobacter prosperus]|uniref:Transcriptional regulator MraZ n=1 Tax=Acidihalobacter prosperus TaxID=160660 RepID=A0A1A6C3E4_9GAMM|nr:division/cell wall cluster transcriptional repressor MraZ [Acidihalobacter prosperus]OBS09082.1 division/cell wall cluster transcriptional repressor MraZ [Acidihalobacter prosperus]